MKLVMRVALVMVIVLSVVILMACMNKYRYESTGEYFNDAIITVKVKAAILDEPSLNNSDINVETYKEGVQLSGFVDSQMDAHKAQRITADVTGVKNIYNDIRVR